MRGALVWFAMLVAGCAPDFGHTAFLCEADPDCPPGQACVHGRCRRGAPPENQRVACGAMPACDVVLQQCCVDSDLGTQCGDVGASCHGTSALCDGRSDCQPGDWCCADGDAVFCDAACSRYACQSDGDCPLTYRCCHDQGTPWGECSTGC